MKTSFSDLLQKERDSVLQKVLSKVPEWAGAGIEVLSRINAEQCSSSATAAFKASLAGTGSVLDLTGGLGVDAWHFSAKSKEVFYNEADPVLFESVQRNFSRLGVRNVQFSNEMVGADGISQSAILAPDRHYDMIYADPARRSASGRKLFIPEDCSPDVIGLLPELWKHTGRIMLKLSPMADITMLARLIGGSLREVYAVSLAGEMKELLCIMEKDHSGPFDIIAAELSDGDFFRFRDEDLKQRPVRYASLPSGKRYLFEPGAALMKTGAFSMIDADKLSHDTHLFLSDEPLSFGKNFEIIEMAPMGRQSIKDFGRKYSPAGVSARGIPLSSDELAKKLGVRSGSEFHIFGVQALDGRYLIATVPSRTPDQPHGRENPGLPDSRASRQDKS